MRALRNKKLLASIPVTTAAVLVFTLLTLIGGPGVFERAVASVAVASGDVWTIRLSDLSVLSSLALLAVEMARTSSNRSPTAIYNHILSMVLFVIALLEFLLIPNFANSTFFLLLAFLLVDVVAGFAITLTPPRHKAKPRPH